MRDCPGCLLSLLLSIPLGSQCFRCLAAISLVFVSDHWSLSEEEEEAMLVGLNPDKLVCDVAGLTSQACKLMGMR